MELNPIKVLFDPIEKLINEHGSATILREHISLFKTQLTILKEKFTEAEARIKQLESENKNLKTEKDELTKKIQTYNKTPKPFFHENLLWLPKNINPYCPACYGTDNKLIPMLTVKIQDMINGKIIHKSVFRCSTFPKCKNIAEISNYPEIKKS